MDKAIGATRVVSIATTADTVQFRCPAILFYKKPKGVIMKKYIVILVLAACIFLGIWSPLLCQEKINPAYIDKVMTYPLTFSIPKEKSDEVWGRINMFILKYGDAKIQVASEFIIQSQDARLISEFGYQAARAPRNDSVEIVVACWAPALAKMAEINSHTLAYYAVTGEDSIFVFYWINENKPSWDDATEKLIKKIK